jgi:hypothetical protein
MSADTGLCKSVRFWCCFFVLFFLCLVQVLDEVDHAQRAWGIGLVVMFGSAVGGVLGPCAEIFVCAVWRLWASLSSRGAYCPNADNCRRTCSRFRLKKLSDVIAYTESMTCERNGYEIAASRSRIMPGRSI